jgi:hypothetical protein
VAHQQIPISIVGDVCLDLFLTTDCPDDTDGKVSIREIRSQEFCCCSALLKREENACALRRLTRGGCEVAGVPVFLRFAPLWLGANTHPNSTQRRGTWGIRLWVVVLIGKWTSNSRRPKHN